MCRVVRGSLGCCGGRGLCVGFILNVIQCHRGSMSHCVVTPPYHSFHRFLTLANSHQTTEALIILHREMVTEPHTQPPRATLSSPGFEANGWNPAPWVS